MKKRLFMIPSLIAAGLFPQKAAAISPGTLVHKPDPKSSIFDLFRMRHKYTLAGHSSHSSHSSHASHASHSSSSGGGYSSSTYSAPVYSPPARTYTPPAPVYDAPVAPPQPVYRAPAVQPRTVYAAPDPAPALSGSDLSDALAAASGKDIVNGWVLQGISGNSAWVAPFVNGTIGETRFVTVGDYLDGQGMVVAVKEISGHHALETDAGLIVEAPANARSISSARTSSAMLAPKTLPGNSGIFRDIVMKVQTGLYVYGYYTGAIDGLVGGQTRTALTKMQGDYGLKVTGTVTPEVLDALRIEAK